MNWLDNIKHASADQLSVACVGYAENQNDRNMIDIMAGWLIKNEPELIDNQFVYDHISLHKGRDFLKEGKQYDIVLLLSIYNPSTPEENRPGSTFERSDIHKEEEWKRALVESGADYIFAFGDYQEVSGFFLGDIPSYAKSDFQGGWLTVYSKDNKEYEEEAIDWEEADLGWIEEFSENKQMHRKSQFDSGFDKITLDSYKKLLNDLIEKEGKIPDYIKKEIPEEIVGDPEIQKLLEIVGDPEIQKLLKSIKPQKPKQIKIEKHKAPETLFPYEGIYTTTDENGTKYWYQNGQLHRISGPAIEYANGTKKWYQYGKLHREDGPAIEEANGNKTWYINGAVHREDGPAIELHDGDKFWYQYGLLHREDEPAVETWSGNKAWYFNGKRHRMDGPAVESVDGHKSWWINGNKLTEKEFKEAIYGELV